MDGPRAMYGIAAVERMTGVSAATIRAWQERYGVASPVPGAGGQVLYSRDDVEQILAFAARVHEDHPSGVRAGLPERGTEEELPPSARLLILLAERDPYAAELSEYFLRTEGYGVETVFTAADALDRIEQIQPDIAVVELLMEGGGGFELARHLVGSGACPVIALSPFDASEHPEAQGVAAFLRKPLDPLALVSTVKDLLGTSAMVSRGRG